MQRLSYILTLLSPLLLLSCNKDNKEAVDLGLSVRWATENVGNSEEPKGLYFAWGEVKMKPQFTAKTSLQSGKSVADISGDKATDVATKHWGGHWRLPTEREMRELLTRCRWQKTEQGGVRGYTVTGPSGNSIFLPFNGCVEGNRPFQTTSSGMYWTATAAPKDSLHEWALALDLTSLERTIRDHGRFMGLSIRAVCE